MEDKVPGSGEILDHEVAVGVGPGCGLGVCSLLWRCRGRPCCSALWFIGAKALEALSLLLTGEDMGSRTWLHPLGPLKEEQVISNACSTVLNLMTPLVPARVCWW